MHLYGKSNFAYVIQLRIFRWGDCPGEFRWVPCDHKGPYRNRKRPVRGREDVMTESCGRGERERFEDAALLTLKMEIRKAGSLYHLEAGESLFLVRKWIFLQSLELTQPCQQFDTS